MRLDCPKESVLLLKALFTNISLLGLALGSLCGRNSDKPPLAGLCLLVLSIDQVQSDDLRGRCSSSLLVSSLIAQIPILGLKLVSEQ